MFQHSEKQTPHEQRDSIVSKLSREDAAYFNKVTLSAHSEAATVVVPNEYFLVDKETDCWQISEAPSSRYCAFWDFPCLFNCCTAQRPLSYLVLSYLIDLGPLVDRFLHTHL